MRLASMAVVGLLALMLVACGGGGSSAAEGDANAVVGAIPFAAGEELTYELRGERGVLGYGTLSVRSEGGQLVLDQQYDEAAPPEGEQATSDSSTVRVDPITLQPHSVERVVQGRDDKDEYLGQYAPDGSSVTTTTGDEDAKERTIELPEHAYENESSLWLWRTLPLAEEYKSRYVSVNTIERTRQTVELEVTGQQRMTVPAGTFDTWRLQVRNGRATRVVWINIEAPHQVVQWDNGDTILLLARPR